MGYNLGLRWQPHEKVSLGATFRSSARRLVWTAKRTFEQYPLRGFYPATNRVAHTDFEFPLDGRGWDFVPAHAKMESGV